MGVIKPEELESRLIRYQDKYVLVDRDVAQLYAVETREVNQAVSNNPDKFPKEYIIELNDEEKAELVKNFDRFSKLKHSTVNPKVFTEKGLYMLATIIKINAIMKTEDKAKQQSLAEKSNKILEEIIEIKDEILADDEEGELVETTTKFEFNLGFAKVSKSIKKIKR